MSNIDLNLLLVFLRIYETRSLSRASHFLRLSQPGVSLALKRLRDHFGDPLFFRTAGSMEPTAFAQALHPVFQRSAESLQESLSFRLDFVPEKSTRVFHVSMSDFGQLLFLPPLLERLAELAPGVRVEVTPITYDTENELSNGTIDLSLGFPHQVKDNFYQQLLVESSFTGLASVSHPEIGDEISLQQYEKVRHLAIRNQTSGFYIVKKHIEGLGIRRKFAANLSNYSSVATILSATHYFMTTPVLVADMLMRQGSLKKVKLPFVLPPIKFMQHWHARHDMDAGNRWFRNLIAKLQVS